MNAGHYFAKALTASEGWVRFDDEQVAKTSEEVALNGDQDLAYLVAYEMIRAMV